MNGDGDMARAAIYLLDDPPSDALAAVGRLEADVEKYKRAHKVAADFGNEKLIPRAVAAEKQAATLAELLAPALVFIEYCVPVTEGEINGFDVVAWCDAVRAAGVEAP